MALGLEVSLGPALGQTITDFQPKFGAPGEYVTLYGAGFYYTGTTPDPVVEARLAGAAAQAWITSDNQVSVRIPSGASSGLFSVRKSGRDWVYSPQVFTVIGPGPYISGFSPTNGNVGTLVFIEGVHFTGATAVRFNGTNAPGFWVASDTQIQVNAPANVTTGPITVVTPLGSHTSAANFNVPPVITGFAPARGRAGTNVVLSGKNFTGTTAVYFNGLNAAFTVHSLTQLTATVPVGATTGPLLLVAPAGNYPTSSNFVVEPTLTSFAPGFGPPGTSVTVQGANFNVGTPVVKFGGVPAAAPTGVSFGQLTVTVPAGATNAPISVTTADGTATSAALFYLPPVLTAFSPTNSAPGTTVILTGQNLLGATSVTFNGQPASFLPPTDNVTLHAVVPVGVSTGPISVTTPGGAAHSGSRLFYAQPVIHSFSPSHGLPGTNVVLVGENFLGTTAVRFNGTNASFLPPTNNTTLVATVPSGATTGPITVVAPAGAATSAAGFTMDYTADLLVTVTDSPDPVTVGEQLVYSVIVQNRGPFTAPSVRLTNTLPASVTLKSATTTAGTIESAANPVVVNLGTMNLAGGAAVTLTVVPRSAGWITNLATAVSGHPDPNLADNTVWTATAVEPPPVLRIGRLPPDRVRLSWPGTLSGFSLQSRSSLAATNTWANVPVAPEIVGEEHVVVETNTAPTRFYRLRR